MHEVSALRHSSHSFTPHTSHSLMRSVHEEEEEEEGDEGGGGEGGGGEGRERVWQSMRSRPPPAVHRRRRGQGSGWSSGEELTQPANYHRSHQNHSSHNFTFSQPGDPEMKTTHTLLQADHTHHHTHIPWRERRKRVDAMTGEPRQFRGPSLSFSPNHPSHHHESHHHHNNVELIGHQPLRASRSYGYGTEYGNETLLRGQVPYSRIGMTSADTSMTENGSVDWEVCVCVCVCV